jgi:GT2 family glycosyltransferase
VTWNVRDQVLACLDAIARTTTGLPCQVLVVDNASSDGAVEAIRSAHPDVGVIINNENVGFARACNQGISRADGRFILLLNPDCLLIGDACAQLAERLLTQRTTGVAGPHILRMDGSDDPSSPRRLPTLWSDVCDRARLSDVFAGSRFFAGHRLPEWDRRASGDVEALSGACMMLRRAALDQIGLLDEAFFVFGEDNDLCVRMGQAGWKVHYLGAASVVHAGSASTRQIPEATALYAFDGRQIFFRKHRGAAYALVHRFLNGTLATVKWCCFSVGAVFSSHYRSRAWIQRRVLARCMSGSVAHRTD